MSTNGVSASPADLERELVGAVIVEPSTLEAIPEISIDAFTDYRLIVVWEAIRDLQCAGKEINVTSIEEQIRKIDDERETHKADAMGGFEFLGGLVLDLQRSPPIDRDVVRRIGQRLESLKLDREIAVKREVVAEIDEFALRDAEAATPVEPSRYGRPFIEFVGQEPDDNPAEVFDVHGLIVRGEPGLFIGEPKVGKTFLLEDLMLHVAAGRREWCGIPIHRRCRVLLFLREDSERTTRRRLHQLARGAGIEHWELADHLSIDATSPLYFDDLNLVKKLERQLKDFDICAIDSLSTIHNADENSVERMAPIMNRWRDLALGTNTAIPLVHHFRKRAEGNVAAGAGNILQRARGSSIIGATTRHAIGVEHGPEKRGQIVISVESNHEVDVEPFVLQRHFGTNEKGERTISHRRVGSLIDAKGVAESARIDPVTLAVVCDASVTGIGARELRTAVIEKLRDVSGTGVRPAKVDASAKRLADAGRIVRLDGDKWRVRPGEFA